MKKISNLQIWLLAIILLVIFGISFLLLNKKSGYEWRNNVKSWFLSDTKVVENLIIEKNIENYNEFLKKIDINYSNIGFSKILTHLIWEEKGNWVLKWVLKGRM